MAEGRRVGKWVWAVAGLVVLAGGAAIALRAIFTEERLRAEIARAGGKALGANVTVEHAGLSLLPPAVVLGGVRVDGVAAGDPPLLTLESGRARLAWAPLLGGRLVVRQLRFESPHVTLRRDAKGVVLPGPLAAPADGPRPPAAAGADGALAPTATVIERLEIAGGTLQLAAADSAESVTVQGIDLAARVEVTDGGTRLRTDGTLELAKLDVAALAAYRATLDRLSPRLTFDVDYRMPDGVLDLTTVRLTAGPMDLAGKGRLAGLPDAPRIAFDVEPSTVQLEELLPLIPPAMVPEGRTPRAKGPVEFAAHVEGPLGDPAAPPSVQVSLSFGGAEFGMEGFALGLADVRGDVVVADTAITLRNLTASLGEGTLAVDGRVAGPAAADSGAMDLRVRSALDLALFQQAGFVPEGTEVAGRLDADVTVATPGADPQQARLGGTVTLANGRMSAPDVAAPLRDLSARVELTGSSALLHEVCGSLGSSTFRGEGRVDDVLAKAPLVTLRGTCPRLDLVELAPPPDSAAASGDATSAGGADGAADSLPALIPPLAPIRAHLELAVDSLLAPDTVLKGTELRADLADAKADVDARVAHASFGKGSVSLANVTGTGVVRDGRFEGSFRAPNGEAYKLPLGPVDGKIDVTGRIVSVQDVTAALFTGRIEGDAVVDLADPRSPQFTIDSAAKGLQANDLVSALTPADGVLQGTLDLQSHFTGRGVDPVAIAQSLVAEGTLDAKGGRLAHGPHTQALWNALKLDEKKAIDFRELVAPFSIRGGKLETENLRIESSDAAWQANGAIGFDGMLDYAVQVELGDALAAEFRRRAGGDLAKLLAGDSGKITLDLHLSGPATGPQVSLDTSKLADRVRKNAAGRLQQGLDSAKNKLLDNLGIGPAADSTAAGADSAQAPPPKLEDALKGLLKRK